MDVCSTIIGDEKVISVGLSEYCIFGIPKVNKQTDDCKTVMSPSSDHKTSITHFLFLHQDWPQIFPLKEDNVQI